MGIFDSIKNAFGKSEAEPDVTVSPGRMLRDAGIGTSGLKFGFGTGSITVSGEIADEADRQRILDILAEAPGIDRVQDDLRVAPPPPPEPAEPPPVDSAESAAAPEVAEEPAAEGDVEEGRTYTVQSGDTLWKISEEMYGNGAKYMKIFEANTDLLDNPDRIFPGQKLKIPDLDD